MRLDSHRLKHSEIPPREDPQERLEYAIGEGSCLIHKSEFAVFNLPMMDPHEEGRMINCLLRHFPRPLRRLLDFVLRPSGMDEAVLSLPGP